MTDADKTTMASQPYQPANLSGTTIGDEIELLELLGSGGSGSVYRARHKLMERICAVKILHASKSGLNAEASLRFQREARLVSSLTHDRIVSVFAFGLTDAGLPYMVMELVAGRTLSAIISEHGPLPLPQAVTIFQQICQALDFAHASGIIHRDLKPGNVMVLDTPAAGETVSIKVLDFGIAKALDPDPSILDQDLTPTGHLIGSPAYMSPEQCCGQELDARSDIYSCGCLMYECLSGKPLFSGATPLAVLYKQVHDRATDTISLPGGHQVPPVLANIVHKALAKDPGDRFQSASSLQEALSEAAASKDLATPLRRSSRQLGSIKAALVLAAATAAVATGYLCYQAAQVPGKHATAPGHDTVHALILQADDWQERGSSSKALAALKRAREQLVATNQERSLTMVNVLVDMAKHYANLRNVPEGIACIDAAEKLLPATMKNSDLAAKLYWVGSGLYLDAGDKKKANDFADRKLALLWRPKNSPEKKCLALIDRGDIYRSLVQLDDADRMYSRALEMVDTKVTASAKIVPKILIARARVAAKRLDPVEQERLLLAAVKTVGTQADRNLTTERDLYTDLGWLYNLTNRFKESDFYLDKATKSLQEYTMGDTNKHASEVAVQRVAADIEHRHGLNGIGLHDLTAAARHFQNGYDLAMDSHADDLIPYASKCLEGLCACALLQGQEAKAIYYWNEALRLSRQALLSDRLQATTIHDAANILFETRHNKEAFRLGEFAARHAEASQLPADTVAALWHDLVLYYRATGMTKEAALASRQKKKFEQATIELNH